MYSVICSISIFYMSKMGKISIFRNAVKKNDHIRKVFKERKFK